MKIKPLIIFFLVVFAINWLLNIFMSLGQSLPYVLVLSVITTALFYFLTFMRNKWRK